MASDDVADILIRIERRLEALERRVDTRIGFFDRRFDAVEERFATLDRRFWTANERFLAIEKSVSTRLNEPQRDFGSLYALLLAPIQERLDRLERHGTVSGEQRDDALSAVTRSRSPSTRRRRR
jgi:hypothetical protein